MDTKLLERVGKNERNGRRDRNGRKCKARERTGNACFERGFASVIDRCGFVKLGRGYRP